jgi:hypothetical protein
MLLKPLDCGRRSLRKIFGKAAGVVSRIQDNLSSARELIQKHHQAIDRITAHGCCKVAADISS